MRFIIKVSIISLCAGNFIMMVLASMSAFGVTNSNKDNAVIAKHSSEDLLEALPQNKANWQESLSCPVPKNDLLNAKQ